MRIFHEYHGSKTEGGGSVGLHILTLGQGLYFLLSFNIFCIVNLIFIVFLLAGFVSYNRTSEGTLERKDMPLSIIDYLCKTFEGINVDTKVVHRYYWKPIIEMLFDSKVKCNGSIYLMTFFWCDAV